MLAEVLDIRLELGLYGANTKPLPGARWRASFYDSGDGQFYSGSDDSPWVAIAWALDERAHRRAGMVRAAKSGEPKMVVR